MKDDAEAHIKAPPPHEPLPRSGGSTERRHYQSSLPDERILSQSLFPLSTRKNRIILLVAFRFYPCSLKRGQGRSREANAKKIFPL
jgi:hypothetical protein